MEKLYFVEITRVADEKMVIYSDLYSNLEPDDNHNRVRWQWDEGNYGCDCNRKIFFEGELTEDHDADCECSGCTIEAPCGHGAYTVVVRDAETMQVVYDELN